MSSFQKKDAVGKGLKSLLQSIDADINKSNFVYSSGSGLVSSHRILLSKITVNPNQPRKDFNEEDLLDLANSIKIHDLIQPITVSKLTGDTYQIISGERRFRAAQMAKLKDIPAYVRNVDNKQSLIELALLENLQRSDLNAIEIALSYQQLIEEFNLTHEDLAERMSKNRSTITNHLRLLKLPPSVQVAVRNGSISMGHARSISGIDETEKQLYIFNQIVSNDLSVRKTEELVKNFSKKKSGLDRPSNTSNNNGVFENKTTSSLYKKIEDEFTSFFNSKVELSHNENNQSGTIVVHYFNKEKLNEIMMKIGINIH